MPLCIRSGRRFASALLAMPFVTAITAGEPKQKIEFATIDGSLPGVKVPKTIDQSRDNDQPQDGGDVISIRRKKYGKGERS
jgi:hypothetical protein